MLHNCEQDLARKGSWRAYHLATQSDLGAALRFRVKTLNLVF